MASTPNLLEVASLIGDTSRVSMLLSLLGGRAMPASDLARAAGVTPQTASAHLLKLVEGGLITVESSGRHRYYRLASADVALALESLNAIAKPKPVRSLRESEQSSALRFARTCYDHLAGELGMAMTQGLLKKQYICEEGRDFLVTPLGVEMFTSFGLNMRKLQETRRHFARQCLDWTERRHHISGALGAAIAERCFELGWLSRISGSRALRLTDAGKTQIPEVFGVEWKTL